MALLTELRAPPSTRKEFLIQRPSLLLTPRPIVSRTALLSPALSSLGGRRARIPATAIGKARRLPYYPAIRGVALDIRSRSPEQGTSETPARSADNPVGQSCPPSLMDH